MGRGGPSDSLARRGGVPRDPATSPLARRGRCGMQPAEQSDCDDHMPAWGWECVRGFKRSASLIELQDN